MIKKIGLSLFMIFFSVNLYAADFDGLWQSLNFPDEYIMIAENSSDGSIIFAFYEAPQGNAASFTGFTPGKWHSDKGFLSQDTAFMFTLVPEEGLLHCSYLYTAEFISPTELLITFDQDVEGIAGTTCPNLNGIPSLSYVKLTR